MLKRLILVALLFRSVATFADPVAYVTDVEGSWEKFLTFVHGNPHIHFAPWKKTVLIRPDARFVFGGDSVDKGIGDLKVLETLVDLKRRYPERVILLAGNRDSIKARLPELLADEALASIPDEMRPWLEEQARGATPADPDARAPRLRWVLERRMGAPHAFEFRRKELASRRRVKVARISDSDVVASFLKDLEPGGLLREYLSRSQIVYEHEGTLYTHGALTAENFGLVPEGDPSRRLPLREWIEPTLLGTRLPDSDWIIKGRFEDGSCSSCCPGDFLVRSLRS
ncbi:MAG: hypothetical protein NDJ89_02830 [Oligoflexia bacterium]|nr:hypothetical protein [Oligoflexia bacterium]